MYVMVADGHLQQNLAGQVPPAPCVLRSLPHRRPSQAPDKQGQATLLTVQSGDSESSSELTVAEGGKEVPLLRVPLHEYNWHVAADRKDLRRTFRNLREAPESIADLQPFVIRGGAASWPACMCAAAEAEGKEGNDSIHNACAGGWTVDVMVKRGGDLRGLVRVAPTMQFPFVMPAHACELARRAGTEAVLPSATRKVRRYSHAACCVVRDVCLHAACMLWDVSSIPSCVIFACCLHESCICIHRV